MGNLGSDTFTRSDAGSWGVASDGQTWANAGGPATTAIVSNHGTIGNFNGFTVMRLGSTQSADIDAVVTLMLSGNALNGAGHAWRVTDNNNCYRIITFDNALYIDRFASGAKTNITSFAKTITTSTQLNVRIQHIGSALKAKAWTGAEPGSWDYTGTESTISSAGYFGLVSDLFGGTGSGVSEYWNYSATDGATGVARVRIGDGYGGCFN